MPGCWVRWSPVRIRPPPLSGAASGYRFSRGSRFLPLSERGLRPDLRGRLPARWTSARLSCSFSARISSSRASIFSLASSAGFVIGTSACVCLTWAILPARASSRDRPVTLTHPPPRRGSRRPRRGGLCRSRRAEVGSGDEEKADQDEDRRSGDRRPELASVGSAPSGGIPPAQQAQPPRIVLTSTKEGGALRGDAASRSARGLREGDLIQVVGVGSERRKAALQEVIVSEEVKLRPRARRSV